MTWVTAKTKTRSQKSSTGVVRCSAAAPSGTGAGDELGGSLLSDVSIRWVIALGSSSAAKLDAHLRPLLVGSGHPSARFLQAAACEALSSFSDATRVITSARRSSANEAR